MFERTVFGRSFLPERTFAARRTTVGRKSAQRRQVETISIASGRCLDESQSPFRQKGPTCRYCLRSTMPLLSGEAVSRERYRINCKIPLRAFDDITCSQSCSTASSAIRDDALEPHRAGSKQRRHTGTSSAGRTLRGILVACVWLYATADR